MYPIYQRLKYLKVYSDDVPVEPEAIMHKLLYLSWMLSFPRIGIKKSVTLGQGNLWLNDRGTVWYQEKKP